MFYVNPSKVNNISAMIKKRTARDFKFIRLLGEGSFSSVYLAVDADIPVKTTANHNSNSINDQHITGSDSLRPPAPLSPLAAESQDERQELRETTARSTTSKRIRKYAIKVCQKSHIKRQGKQMAIMREKEIMNILNQCRCKHFIRLFCTFQDLERLFFVMSYAENGDLLTYMLKHPLSIETVRKFTSQLVSALEQLHRLNIVHRDLKPENILLSELLDLLISDFGSAQIYHRASMPPTSSSSPAPLRASNNQLSSPTIKATAAPTPAATVNHLTSNHASNDRRNSFVGTAQYVSPEMLTNREASYGSDLWALGVIVYQMITNVMPFDAPNEYLIYKKIQSLDYDYPDNFDGDACDLISKLIKLEPNERLGATDDVQSEGYQSIRRHRFLSAVDNEQIMTPTETIDDDRQWDELIMNDPDLRNIDKITPGLDETEILRLLTDS